MTIKQLKSQNDNPAELTYVRLALGPLKIIVPFIAIYLFRAGALEFSHFHANFDATTLVFRKFNLS